MVGFLADAVVLVHLGWILFLIFGALPGRRRAWVKYFHLGGLAFATVLTAGGWVCPLTYLEVWLRGATPQVGGYQGTFIGHYAERLVYLAAPRWAVLSAVLGIAGLSVWAYAGGGRRTGRGLEERP